jgi:hypothetical protein
MKHAGEAALNQLEDVLVELRRIPVLKEKKRGVFCRGASAFLHFHENPAGLFADVRMGPDWVRLPVNTRAEKRSLLAKIASAMRMSSSTRRVTKQSLVTRAKRRAPGSTRRPVHSERG